MFTILYATIVLANGIYTVPVANFVVDKGVLPMYEPCHMTKNALEQLHPDIIWECSEVNDA